MKNSLKRRIALGLAVVMTLALPAMSVSAAVNNPNTVINSVSRGMSGAVNAIRNTLEISNDVTAAEILSLAQQDLPAGVTVAFAEGRPFELVPATVGYDGLISGLLVFSGEGATSGRLLNIVIPALEAAVPVAELDEEVEVDYEEYNEDEENDEVEEDEMEEEEEEEEEEDEE